MAHNAPKSRTGGRPCQSIPAACGCAKATRAVPAPVSHRYRAYRGRSVSVYLGFMVAVVSGLLYHHAAGEPSAPVRPVASEQVSNAVMPVMARSADTFLSSLG